jgi:uncharacterized membrane protein YhaH (DUF805 family)
LPSIDSLAFKPAGGKQSHHSRPFGIQSTAVGLSGIWAILEPNRCAYVCAFQATPNPASDKDFVGAFLMATEWFYSRGGNQVGPVSSAELRACAERGTLLPDDWVWKQGMTDWVPARRINGLFPAPTELSVLPEEPRHLPGLPSQPQQQAAVSTTPQRDPGNWYFEAWRNWRSVRGRACRMEFWTFFAINWIIGAALSGAASQQRSLALGLLVYGLASIVALVTVAIRRLHDLGNSGWWILIALLPFIGTLVLLILLLRDSEPGTNRFGANPKGVN